MKIGYETQLDLRLYCICILHVCNLNDTYARDKTWILFFRGEQGSPYIYVQSSSSRRDTFILLIFAKVSLSGNILDFLFSPILTKVSLSGKVSFDKKKCFPS